MKWIFAPAIALVAPLNNNVRVPLGGIMFAVPLVISLWSPPASWMSGSALAIGLTFLLAWYYLIAVYFSATDSWGAVNRLAQRLNEHDLRRVEGLGRGQSAGQFSFMINTLSEAQGKLRELVKEARHSADAAKTAADEMATGNVNLSQRTEQQASTLEETASGMEELAATVKQNADNCKLASELASNASGVASKGADMVHRIVTNMEQIDRSSKKIVDIIGVIESIAFQTNILALNAAVEAARAGEQGRGFAVVAGEVRNLAQRSAAAAKEIKTLIGESVSNVDQGSKLVRDSGHVINDVVVSVQQVSELIAEIAVASREQNSGVQEMNKALIQLESVTQQNAALVEEAAASAMTFQDEARRLFELVGQFRLDDDEDDEEYDYPLPAQEPAMRQAPVPELSRPAPRAVRDAGGSRPAVKADPDDEWQEF
jgi:methyl-accepting chemotaxis protein